MEPGRLGKILEPHLAVLHRLRRRLTRTRADAEDLAQEALVRAFEKGHELRDPDRARAWLLALTRNLHLNRVRDGRAHLLVLSAEIAAGQLRGDLEREVQDRSLPDELALALRALPEEQATAIWLREVEGFSYEELAEAMATPVGTVRSRLARARAGLLEALAAGARAGGAR